MFVLAELLAGLVSVTPAELTNDENSRTPALVGWTVSRKLVNAPLASVPRLKMTLLPATLGAGLAGETLMYPTPGGSVLVKMTLGAAFGPALVTVTPKVIQSLVMTGCAGPVMATPRSASVTALVTRTTTIGGSGVGHGNGETVTMLVMKPAAVG